MSLSQREVEDLKGVLSETVKQFLGFNETSLVSAALNCLTKGYDKQKTVDKLSDLLDSGQASHFADKIYSVYHDYSSNRHAKHKRRKDEGGEEGKETKVKKRRFMDDDEAAAAAAIPGPGTPSPGALTADKIKEMMENARRELQERKAQLGIHTGSKPSAPPAPTPSPRVTAEPLAQSQQAMNDSVEKAKRAAQLQSQIQQRLLGLSMGMGSLPGLGMPPLGAPPPGPGGPPSLMGGQAGARPPPSLMGGQRGPQPLGGIPPLMGGGPMGGMSHPPPLIPGLGQQQSQQQKGSGGGQAGKPTPVILNELGQTIDAKTGQTIQLSHYTPTLKANIRAKRREKFKGLIEKPPEEIADSKFFDARMGNMVAARQRRTFKFHERGKFEQLAQRLRAKAQLERLQTEIAQTAKRTGIASAAKLATIAPKKEIQEGEVPDMEWWDAFIVNKDSYQSVPDKVDRGSLDGITRLVEHPIQLKPPADSSKVINIPVYLTKKERKKLRRQSRQEAEKEEQEKIRLGLAPQPEPKVRMANLMRVLGTEAVQDPTKVEAHVRAQMAKRQRGHEEANAARKLTTEQRREKKVRKIKEDTSLGINVAVYRVRDLNNPAHKFKVETNCQQLFMTGLVILHRDCNVVVVEGGPKQQRKFKRLMLHRIKWGEGKKHAKGGDDSEEEEEEARDRSNRCVLVWEGVVKTRSFGDMKFKTCPTASFAHEQFNKLGVGHYWHQAFSGAVLETATDD